jgi:hypothetical protein
LIELLPLGVGEQIMMMLLWRRAVGRRGSGHFVG